MIAKTLSSRIICVKHVIEHMHILYDAGEMINVGIELGQIEGGNF